MVSIIYKFIAKQSIFLVGWFPLYHIHDKALNIMSYMALLYQIHGTTIGIYNFIVLNFLKY